MQAELCHQLSSNIIAQLLFSHTYIHIYILTIFKIYSVDEVHKIQNKKFVLMGSNKKKCEE